MTIKRGLYFGGSFDPPHLGHLEMLLALARDSWCDTLFVVPTSINPLKLRDSQSGPWSSPSHRRAWVELLIQEAKDQLTPAEVKKIELCEIELAEPQKTSYTIDTLSTLQASRPDIHSWNLAVGSDLLESFSLWKNVFELLKKVESVWVFPRGEEPHPLHKVSPELLATGTFRIMSQKIPAVSSTQIRQLFGQEKSAASCKNLIPARVLENIQTLL